MTTLYREFVLDRPGIWLGVRNFVKGNHGPLLEQGKPLHIIVTTAEKKRTNPQNRFFHGPVLDAITEQAWWSGRQFPKEFWKEYFRKKYLLKDEYTTPDGEIVQVYWSTADLDVGQMADFLGKVQSEASTEWGVIFE